MNKTFGEVISNINDSISQIDDEVDATKLISIIMNECPILGGLLHHIVIRNVFISTPKLMLIGVLDDYSLSYKKVKVHTSMSMDIDVKYLL